MRDGLTFDHVGPTEFSESLCFSTSTAACKACPTILKARTVFLSNANGVQHPSPGQGAAPPWVKEQNKTQALKGRNKKGFRVSPLQGFVALDHQAPRAALRSALGYVEVAPLGRRCAE